MITLQLVQQQNGKKKRKPALPEAETNEGNNWVVGYNPTVPQKLDVKLDHDMDHDSVVCCVNFSSTENFLQPVVTILLKFLT